MSPERLAVLRRIAEAATEPVRTEGQTIANGEHMAAFDPATVLSLLDEIERLWQELAVLKPVYDEARMGSCGDCDQAMREAPMRDEDEVLGPCDVCEEMYAAVEKAEAYYWQREQERSVGA